jgi:hypothetical protein
MNKNTNTSVNTNIDISFIVDVNLRNSLEYTIVVVNNTNSWDTVKTYKNIEYNIDLLFHLHKLDIITVKLNRTHRLTDSTIRRNLEILNYISKHGLENFKENYSQNS